MTTPLPGAAAVTAGTWHDHVPAVAAAARTTLRISDTDPDAPRFPAHAAAACRAIDTRLGLRAVAGRMVYRQGGVDVVTYAPDDVPADVVEAAVQLTVGLFRRKDAPLGVLPGGIDGLTVYVSRDQLAQVDSLLSPYVEDWGMA